MKKDPILRYEKTLKEMGVLTDAKIDAIKKEIGDKVDATVKFSEDSDWPALAEIMDDVYTGGPVAV
jgi:TPP-dependent pyruvate/acetoin dehydrogenase alpha subunit